MRIGYLQFTPEFGEVARNLERVALALEGADADLLVLPELFASGYQFRSREELLELAEPPDGPTAEALIRVAARGGFHLAAGFPERDGDRAYNSAMLVGPQGRVGVYRKTHLFDAETEIFEPGDSGFQVFAVGEARVGLMVCWDWIFPESARTLALQGAEVIAHTANLVLPWCQSCMPARCIENRVFAVTANRCGEERRVGDGLRFTGQSVIVSPRGETLARGPEQGEALEVVETDLALARDKKPTARNDLFGDRRPEMYRLG
jgi:predicted amidohydrolase